VKRISKLIWI